MYLYKLVINDEMIDYVLEKYGNKWQVDDVISNEILDDLLKREFNKQQRVKDEKGKMTKEKRPLKDDKRKLTGIKIAVDLEKRIQNVEIDLNKAKEKMLMERAVIIIDSDTSSNSDDIPPGTEILETSSDDIPPITHPFQTSSDDTIKSSSKDTFSSDDTWEQKNISDDQRTIFKGKPASSSISFQGKQALSSKLSKAKSKSSSKSLSVKKLGSSKHLTPRRGSSFNPYQAKLRSSSKDVQADVGESVGSNSKVIIIDSNTSSSSDDIPLSTETLETSSDDIPPSTHPFQASSDDTLKSSSDSDEKRIVFKDKSGSSSTSLSSKHLASRTHSNSNPYQAKLRSSSKDVQANVGARAGSLNLLVPTKRPPPLRFGPCSSENLGTNSE
ncbi:hypothetical protein Tco_0831787 [Tanacetum coccineum]